MKGRSAAVDTAEDAQTVLSRERGRLFGLALMVVRDPTEAQDVVQEAMAQAWRSWDSLRDPAARDAWLTRICMRTALRTRRRLRAALRTRELLPAEAAAADRVADLDLARAMARLSMRQRAVLALHYHGGYTLDECAAMLGSRPGTVRSHLARALASLRESLRDA